MSSYRKALIVLLAVLIAGPALALPATASAFAAVFDAPLPTRELILLGSLLLLSVALALGVGQRRRRVDRTLEGPDLRWWKNPR